MIHFLTRITSCKWRKYNVEMLGYIDLYDMKKDYSFYRDPIVFGRKRISDNERLTTAKYGGQVRSRGYAHLRSMNKNKTARNKSNPLITSPAELLMKTCVLNFMVLFAKEKSEGGREKTSISTWPYERVENRCDEYTGEEKGDRYN